MPPRQSHPWGPRPGGVYLTWTHWLWWERSQGSPLVLSWGVSLSREKRDGRSCARRPAPQPPARRPSQRPLRGDRQATMCLIHHVVEGSVVLSESTAYLVVRGLSVAQANPARRTQRSLRLPLCCLTAELCEKRTSHRGFYAEVCNLLVNSTSVPAVQLRPLAAPRSTGPASRGRRPSPRDMDQKPPGVQNPSGRLLRRGQHSSTLQNPVSRAGHNVPLPTGQHRTSSFSQALETLLRIISGHRDLQSSTPT